MIFDTHCHYNMEPLFASDQLGTAAWERHWKEAQDKGVVGSMVVGADLPSSQRARDLAQLDSCLKAAIGIHPSEYQEAVEKSLEVDIAEQITSLAALFDPGITLAIGETGLDYFRLPETGSEKIKDLQKEAFTAHIKLAEKLNLPLIIHARDTGEEAYWDILQILKTAYQGHKPFILHCVSGPEAYLKEALAMGAYIGVAGNVTYKNSEHIRNLVRLAPAERILLETDAPFLPPQEFRGKTCEPWMISLTGEYLRDELSVSLEKVLENTSTVFQIEL